MPTEITPEQRDSLTPDADLILRITDAIMDHIHEGVSTAETAAAIRAEKEIAENGDAIAAARAEYGQEDKTSVPGILAMLRREVLRKAGWNAAEEDWIGAIECLAQADAYAYAEREIRERSLGGPVTGAEARSQSPHVRDANQRLISLVAWLEADPGNPELLVSQFGQNERAAIIRALTPKKPEEAEAEDRGYRAGVEAALTASIQMADAEDGPEPTIERIVRLYYTGHISEWDLANSYADQFLAAIRALSDKPKEAEGGKC